MNVPFVAFGDQYRQHKEEYDEAITKCLEKGKLILQEDVEQFEENLAKFLGFKYAVGVADGTNAIILALKAKGVHEGHVISVTDYTFKATHEAVVHNGNTLNRIDIDGNRLVKLPAGWNIPVHIEGMVAPVNDYSIVEDAAQAFGAEGVGKSGIATYSFYPAKILGGIGDGGAVCTNDKEIYEKLKLLRHHWQTGENEQYGFNSRLDNIHAAFLNVKLKYIQGILDRREEIAMKYKTLEGLVGLPYYQEGRVWQDWVCTTPNPKGLAAFLKDKGIQTLGYGMTPNHKAFNQPDLPNVTKLYAEMIRLPLNETLSDEQIDHVISSVKEYVSTVQ